MELSETAAILDAILNFSKRSTLQGVHPADSERVHPRLPKLINKNTLHKISGFSYFCRTKWKESGVVLVHKRASKRVEKLSTSGNYKCSMQVVYYGVKREHKWMG